MSATHTPPSQQTGSDLRATDRRNGVAAGKVLAAGALGLVLAIALNSQQLLREARQKPFGWERDASVAVWEPVEGVSSAVGVHLPRLWADEAFDRSVTDPGTTPDQLSDSEQGSVTAGEPRIESTPSSVVIATPSEDPSAQPSETLAQDASPTPPASGDSGSTASGGAAGDQQPAGDEGDDTAASAPTTTVPWFPTLADPLQLHIMGDSMVRFFGDTMVGLANDKRVIDASAEHQLSSGLTRPDFYDWPARIVEVMAADDPDAVVMMFGGNDAQALVVNGQIERPFAEAWVQEYSARVGHAMDLVTTDPDRILIWVGQPIMESPSYDEKMQRLNEIFDAEASERERVLYVDIRNLFRGPNGGFSRYVADLDGQLTDVRLTDGVHLSTIGGRWLSEVLLDELGLVVDLTSGAPS